VVVSTTAAPFGVIAVIGCSVVVAGAASVAANAVVGSIVVSGFTVAPPSNLWDELVIALCCAVVVDSAVRGVLGTAAVVAPGEVVAASMALKPGCSLLGSTSPAVVGNGVALASS
jgi:hypothetical protein